MISRAVLEIFSNDFLEENLAFRGGTALHKLYLHPQARYSEDIDLVQLHSGPAKPMLEAIRDQLLFLGGKDDRQVKLNEHNCTVYYQFETEMSPPPSMRVKIEINTREPRSTASECQHSEFYHHFSNKKTPISYRNRSLISTPGRNEYSSFKCI